MKFFSTSIVILILLSSSFIGLSYDVKKISISKSYNGNILYVGGNGTGNYTKIQDAIDNASDGDTVFVFDDLSPYYCNIEIAFRKINLIGENKNTTVIDSNGKGNTINAFTKQVNIRGFSIRNSGGESGDAGFYHEEGYNDIISNNIITSNQVGIFLYCSDSCNITKNIITNNKYGIIGGGHERVGECWNNNISINIMSRNSQFGIYLLLLFHNGITSNNTIINNRVGIGNGYNYGSDDDNILVRNNISCNLIGLLTFNSNAIITQNNFMKNIRHAQCRSPFFEIPKEPIWNENYWGKARNYPYPIPTKTGFIFFLWPGFPQFDMNPAKEPYNIPEGNNIIVERNCHEGFDAYVK